MFTIKQDHEAGSKMWPGVSCVDTMGAFPEINGVSVLFAAGGNMEFYAGKSPQTIYVMNENGSTVGRYYLHNPKAEVSAFPPPS